MLASYINKNEKDICSIEYLNHEFDKEELLLSNQNKNETIIEEDEDQFFELYITPYSQKQAKALKSKDLSINEDTTIIKGSQREESMFQAKCQQYMQEVKRLKKIIIKKNKVIGDLTEELKIYYEQPKKQSKNKKSLSNSRNSQQYEHSKNKEYKENECENNKCRNELAFYQKNNLQLYEQMSVYKSKYENIQKLFANASQEIKKYRQNQQKIEAENTFLKKQNLDLLKSTKKYLNQGAKEIKIMSKMREVLAEKLSLKQMNIILPDYTSKSNAKMKSSRQRQIKKLSERSDANKISKSLERQTTKQKDLRQRCYSNDVKKIKL